MKTLFDQTSLSGIPLRNRLVRSATWEGLADGNGRVTSPLVDIYRNLAAGEVGLIISSYMYVSPEGKQNNGQLSATDDECIPGLQQLADAVHAEGGSLVAQLVHCGGQASREFSGMDPVAPSAIADKGYGEIPRALTQQEIDRIKADFAGAAQRIQESGFDGIQLHGAHGYLLSQFISPFRNRRNDRYGGCIENRCRFTLEVFEAIRETVGETFPILIKINGSDFFEGGTTVEDSSFLASRLEEVGIAAIEVSGGTPGSRRLGAVRADILHPEDEAYFLEQAAVIRKSVPSLPLILVGGLRSVEVMERILEEGAVDYFAMARPLIREPDLPRRWRSGDLHRAGCRSCLGCFRPARKGEGIRCVRITEEQTN